MRLIDADRLKDSIMFTCDLGGWIGETLLQIKKLAVKYIETAPTIDAVEVIRCKDCKWGIKHNKGIRMFECLLSGLWNPGYHFCANGIPIEKREDGEA